MDTQEQEADYYAVEKTILDIVFERGQNRFPSPALAKRTLRTAVEEAQQRMRVASAKGLTPGVTDVFTGERIPITYERRPHGAYELLITLAVLTHATIIIGEKTLSLTPLRVESSVIRDLMHFIVSDTGISINKPIPYSQAEMRRAYEEWKEE